MLGSLDMKAESSWAWSGEWVKGARYESGLMGVRGQFGKGLGLQMRIRMTTCLGQRSDGLGIRMT